ncbi:SDR family oxidoreductase [Phenylobacterium aquaticum]|uniref:SDR family oxidoreductase n=1 Tax=Phenylobacterium aquaticum TaxID=1763816 RepID=UPI0026F0D1E2|nr:SDR family oxidoreductase [Phenylobacterium aquaticum]
MSASLNGQTVVVIGGASGIGFGVAEAAQAQGARVIIGSSQPANVTAAVARLGGAATGQAIDVTDEASVAAFFAAQGGLDHLVFTAGDWGASRGGPPGDIDLAAAQAAFAVRFWGALAVVKHASRIIAPTGSITLTDGMMAHRPMKGAAVSTAMLGAIEHLTQGLAVDLAPIRVNCVCPGLILTERNARMGPDMLKAYTARSPLARPGAPAEVAQAYLYLMAGGYTTGQILRVDGGGSVV